MSTTTARSAGLVLVLGVAATLSAQSGTGSPQPPQQPQVFRTEANYVRVDVYPTKDRQPLLGLTKEDFEIFEDGVLQRVEAFEHVVVQPAGPQETRREPETQRDSLREVANPRNRVFVIFLDIPNVTVDGAHTINEPLIRLLDRILGPDDLVGVMTPAMAASQVVFARKTQIIQDSLRTNWAWGRRFSFERDAREKAYLVCYPLLKEEAEAGLSESVLATELIRRKRERATLESLQDLVRYLHALREERKAILTVTEGWLLYRENASLMTLRKSGKWQEPIPGSDPIGVGPTGQPVTKDPRNHPDESLSKNECDTDRMRLASMDNDQFMRDIMDEANRANASFYPIDPRGLVAFDTPIGPKSESLPPVLDRQSLRTRLESLHTLALNTDGLAVLNSNDLDAGLKRISDDLTSYYLLGYYSTNTKLDGRFRSLRVRVKQPGVQVRARRGYRAANLEEVTAARRAAEAPAANAASAAVAAAVGGLARIRPDAPFRINVAAFDSGGSATVWIAGETYPTPGAAEVSSTNATVDIEVRAGNASQTAKVALDAGQKAFLTSIKLPAAAGPIDVRARLRHEGSSVPLTDAVQIQAGAAAQPLVFRRGPSTANKLRPAADFRFSRSERVRLEIPIGDGVKAGAGRVLDRNGQPLQLPVTVLERVDDQSGQRWITADIALAALGAGDYVVELSSLKDSSESKVLTGIRVSR